MSGFLLDTSVISAFSPERPALAAAQVTWFSTRADLLHVSAVTFAEVEQGAAKLLRAGAVARANQLRRWLDQVLADFGERVIELDAGLGRAAGQLSDDATARGRHPGFIDIAIAATAKVHGLTVLTRNLRHFEPLGIDVLDPLAVQP